MSRHIIGFKSTSLARSLGDITSLEDVGVLSSRLSRLDDLLAWEDTCVGAILFVEVTC